jgi:hypothetical protein
MPHYVVARQVVTALLSTRTIVAASLTPGSVNSVIERVGSSARRAGFAASGPQAIEVVYDTHQSIALESAASRS